MRDLVLWGHSLADYQKMFALEDGDLAKKIIEVASGPSSFNMEMTQHGQKVVSIDEMFGLPMDELKEHAEAEFAKHVTAIKAHASKFNWGDYGQLEELVKSRRAGMQKFFSDFVAGSTERRYRPGTAIQLPEADFKYDIALISHHLLSKFDEESINYDINVIKELVRVADEVRIFPLLDNNADISEAVGPVMLALQQDDIAVEIKEVPYNLQDKANAMMRVRAQACQLE